mgnify:FL=1
MGTNQWGYSAWRFNIYMAHGGLTYREIDDAVTSGRLRVGMSFEEVKAIMPKWGDDTAPEVSP